VADVPELSAHAHRSLVTRVLRFIDENLSDPGLSSRTVAAAHFISVRQLQKVFEAEGKAVTTTIRNRRLERCRHDLADPALRGRPIAAVAARWGFLDAAHFSRLFRSAFGASPREYRTSHRAA
jgi:AraC-like DNA-binding protein